MDARWRKQARLRAKFLSFFILKDIGAKFLNLPLNRVTCARFLRQLGRLFLWVAAAWICLAALLGFGVIFYPQQTLTVDSGEVKADVLVVLGGAQQERAERAAELFKEGEAPEVLVTGFGDSETNVRLLEIHGVPSNVIGVESKSLSTFENAKFSIPMMRKMDIRRAIIITSWYHSRRALACFRHLAPDITFYSRPSYLGYQPDDSHRGEISGYVKLEYIKMLVYWLWHGVSPIYFG